MWCDVVNNAVACSARLSLKPFYRLMAKIRNIKPLLRKLEKLERAANRKHTGDVVVGYGASYASFVHENVEMKLKGKPRGSKTRKRDKQGKFVEGGGGYRGHYWDPQGRAQAKFLEEPARTYRKAMAKIVVDVTRATGSMMKGLLFAGLRLQRESQKLVPVETGNLKGSAFTEKE